MYELTSFAGLVALLPGWAGLPPKKLRMSEGILSSVIGMSDQVQTQTTRTIEDEEGSCRLVEAAIRDALNTSGRRDR